MATASIFLDTRSVKKGGVSPLKITIRHRDTSSHLSLGIDLPPKFWKEGRVVGHHDRHALNARISKTLGHVVEVIDELTRLRRIESMTATQIRDRALGMIDREAGDTLGTYFPRAVERRHGRTRELYEITLKRLREFREDLDGIRFETLDRDFLIAFDRHLAKTSPSPNARAINMRNLRAVCNEAVEDGITTTYPFKGYQIQTVKTRKRALRAEDLRLLPDLAADQSERRYVDYFLLSFMLLGINIGDLCALREITPDGYIEFSRKKTHRLYRIRVEPEAKEIIDRWHGSRLLLDVGDTYRDGDGYKSFLGRMNKCLHVLGHTEIGPKGSKTRHPVFPELTTYWARHSWATIAARLGVSRDVIRMALGHGEETVTDVYIDFDMALVEEANRKVLDHVFGQKSGKP